VGSPSRDQDVGLERLKFLEGKLACAPARSVQRLTLIDAIRIEADAYRKSLDAEQAEAVHGAEPGPAAGHRAARRRAIPLRGRTASRR
jgi:hypothetical protein